jgi:hypothetical protein
VLGRGHGGYIGEQVKQMLPPSFFTLARFFYPPPACSLELYSCNDEFHSGTNQQFDYDQATGIFSPRVYGAEESCVVVCGKGGGSGN